MVFRGCLHGMDSLQDVVNVMDWASYCRNVQPFRSTLGCSCPDQNQWTLAGQVRNRYIRLCEPRCLITPRDLLLYPQVHVPTCSH